MEEKIKVFLRLSQKSHPLYEELWKFPPENIKYIFRKDLRHYSDSRISLKGRLKNFIWLNFLKFFPAFYPLSSKNCDVIHSTNNIIPFSKTPWIIDTESGHGLFSFNYKKLKSRIYKFILKLILKQKSFRKIIAWSEICKKDLVNFLGEGILNKIEVVYPAHHIIKNFNKKNGKKIKLLFVSRRFEHKGGYELIDAFNLLKNKKDLELIIISDIPSDIEKKYSKNKNVKLIDANLTRKELEKFFKEADIFVYPTRIDSFGFVLIEAMAYKLPIITTKFYAIPEIVKKGVNGILIKPLIKWSDYRKKYFWENDYDYLKEYQKEYLRNSGKFVKNLSEKIEYLIKNPELRKKMGEAGFKEVKEGKFSVKERNKKLEKIYVEAFE